MILRFQINKNKTFDLISNKGIVLQMWQKLILSQEIYLHPIMISGLIEFHIVMMEEANTIYSIFYQIWEASSLLCCTNIDNFQHEKFEDDYEEEKKSSFKFFYNRKGNFFYNGYACTSMLPLENLKNTYPIYILQNTHKCDIQNWRTALSSAKKSKTEP